MDQAGPTNLAIREVPDLLQTGFRKPASVQHRPQEIPLSYDRKKMSFSGAGRRTLLLEVLALPRLVFAVGESPLPVLFKSAPRACGSLSEIRWALGFC